MREYRIYPLSKSNHIDGVPTVIVCRTDHEAVGQARQMLDGHDLEVWLGPELIARLKSQEPKSPWRLGFHHRGQCAGAGRSRDWTPLALLKGSGAVTEAERLRAQAEKYNTIARSITDQRTLEALKSLEEECLRKAEELERDQDT
jgi:hypothetical protein